jgi:predicted methyltransferase
VMQTIYSMLKPGAVFGVIDHVGVPGADNAQLHRVDVEAAIEVAEAAGFVVEAQSDILRNPADDHSQGVFAEGIRGNTDRFLLKLRRPAE